MRDQQQDRPLATVEADGTALTLHSLPPPNPRRWVSRRKALVITAIRDGLLTVEEACARYSLSIEELTTWQWLFERNGTAGLRVTRTQEYRSLVNEV
jgi:hypothetical protein